MDTAVADSVATPVAGIDRPRHRVGMQQRLLFVSRLCGVGSAVTGFVVLAGYLERWPWAIRLWDSLPPMYPNAALGFLIGGLSVLAASNPRPHRAAVGTAGFSVVLVGAVLSLLFHVLDLGPTWLEGLWPDDPVVAATSPVPGRPVAETCVAFICVAVAGLLLSRRRAPVVSQAFAIGTINVGLAAVLGYVIGVDRAALGSLVAIGMALHTGVGLLMLGVAVLLAQPSSGVFSRLTHAGASGRLARRLVLVVVVAPILVAAADAALAEWLPDAKLAQSIAAIVQILVLATLVLVPMTAADRIEHESLDALRVARALQEEAGERDALTAGIVAELMRVPLAPPGWEVGHRQEAAFGELPGDSCQVLDRGDGRFLVAVVDVAGHGTGPALQAMWLRAQTAALWRAGHGLADIARALDRAVGELGTIATGVLVDVHAASGVCEYLNAGHPAAMVASHDVRSWCPTQPLFGYADHPTVQQHRLDHGDLLLVHTDGITEAFGPHRDLLGDRVVADAVHQRGAVTAQMLADRCMDAALAHSGTRLRDDALVVVLQRR